LIIGQSPKVTSKNSVTKENVRLQSDLDLKVSGNTLDDWLGSRYAQKTSNWQMVISKLIH
jgi:hypothetical protein